MASLTCSLLASLWTRKVYLLRCVSSIDFSLMTGRRMICGCLERHAYTSAIVASEGWMMSSVSALSTSTTLSESARMIETPRQVARRQLEDGVASGGHNEHPTRRIQRGEVADQLVRLGRIEAQIVNHAQRAVAELGSQRAVQREALHALGQALLVAARVGPEDDAAAGVVGRAARSLAGAPGALLAVRLGAATGHLTAGERVVGTRPPAGQLGGHRLVHDSLIDRRREERLGQLDRAQLGT